jgi:D-3-phosphoglycerate dehydrogenase
MVNSMQITGQRNIEVGEHHGAPRSAAMDTIQVKLETDAGETSATGAVIVDKPRLVSVDGIQVECPLMGRLIYLRNYDVPGVIGHVGTVLGKNNINIANFSLGRDEAPVEDGKPLRAVALVEVDGDVPDSVLAQLKENPAVRLAVTVNPGE